MQGDRQGQDVPGNDMEHQVMLDFFTPADHIGVIPRYLAAKAAADAEGRRPSLKQMGAELGVNRMTVKRARNYIKQMEEERMTEPYRELHACPKNASRWKPRQKKD
jgi:deoxyinosine 3'endonuclease (endonuclease V)